MPLPLEDICFRCQIKTFIGNYFTEPHKFPTMFKLAQLLIIWPQILQRDKTVPKVSEKAEEIIKRTTSTVHKPIESSNIVGTSYAQLCNISSCHLSLFHTNKQHHIQYHNRPQIRMLKMKPSPGKSHGQWTLSTVQWTMALPIGQF